MSHWQDTMVDRPETDGAGYVTGAVPDINDGLWIG